MGIFEKAAKAIGKDAAKVAAISALEAAQKSQKALNKMIDRVLVGSEEQHYKKEQEYLSRKPDHKYLIIQRPDSRKQIFIVCDRNGTELYYVKGELIRGAVWFRLFNQKDQAIGSVRQKILSIKKIVSEEEDPADFIIRIDSKKVAVLKTPLLDGSYEFTGAPCEWVVKGSYLPWNFTVSDGEIEIAHISKRRGYDVPTYILDFPDESLETFVLLIVLTLIVRADNLAQY